MSRAGTTSPGSPYPQAAPAPACQSPQGTRPRSPIQKMTPNLVKARGLTPRPGPGCALRLRLRNRLPGPTVLCLPPGHHVRGHGEATARPHPGLPPPGFPCRERGSGIITDTCPLW